MLLDFVVIVFFYMLYCVLFWSVNCVVRFCSVRFCCYFCSDCVMLDFVLIDCAFRLCSFRLCSVTFPFVFTYIFFCYTAMVDLFCLCSVTFDLSHCALLDGVLADTVLLVCISRLGRVWYIIGNNYQFRNTFV